MVPERLPIPLESSKDHASAPSLLHEKIDTHDVDNDLRELLETQVGVPKIPSFTGSRPTRGSDAQIIDWELIGNCVYLHRLTGLSNR